MSALLVTYDLKKPGQKYDDFYDIIKSYGYARLSESSYAIATNESTKTVYDKLAPYIDKNDKLFVMGLKEEWTGFGTQEIYDWLHKNLA
jgi:CRISPR-associated endonuclease Cas2